MEMPQIYKPTPRRTFEFTPASSESSIPPSPSPENQNAELFLKKSTSETAPAPNRTRSILNLTSSTLLGIYSPTTGEGNRDELHTPWGTGAQTPVHRASVDSTGRPDHLSAAWTINKAKRRTTSTVKPRAMSMKRPRSGFRRYWIPLIWQTTLLYVSGLGFGVVITQLQRTQQIAPVPVPSFASSSWVYQALWGCLGVLIGNALPLIDALWDDGSAIEDDDGDFLQPNHARTLSTASEKNGSLADSGTGPLWYSAVRSVGAFVGIAFALRRIPWQSTLQVSLTLAIANPVLWYLIDRSKPGFVLSTVVGILGTFLLLLVNPDFVPVPAIYQDRASEKFGIYTWLASILFCTSLCFGAIGRKLQL